MAPDEIDEAADALFAADVGASIGWLARRMMQYGQTIAAGDTLLSGPFIRPVECPPGTRIEADFGSFGTVTLSFD